MTKILDASKALEFNFPSTFDEITKEVLIKLTSHVRIPANKVIVCIIGNYDLFELATSIKGKKSADVSVVPLIAKADTKWLTDNGFDLGDMIVTTDSGIQNSVHLHINSGASYNSLISMLSNEEMRMAAVGRRLKDSDGNSIERINCIEFKVMNTFDIVGAISMESTLDDPFKAVTTNTNAAA